jgi:hypothetical protein
MSDFFSRQARRFVSNALAPVEATSGRIIGLAIGMAGLGAVATACFIATLIFLSVALDLWLTKLADPVIAALAVAGFYLVIALLCVVLAISYGRKKKSTPSPADPKPAPAPAPSPAPVDSAPYLSENIDETLAPFVAILQQFGLKREEVAVRLAAEATKQIGPLALVGIALLAGFLGERALNSSKSSE